MIRSSWSSGSQTLPSVVAYGERELTAAARELPIDFAISPASFTYFSYNDVLAGRVAPAEFAGKTVYVGATAIELGDMVPVPVHRAMPGVALLALASQTLLDGVPWEAPAWLQFLSLAFWSGLCAAFFHRCRWRANLLAFGILMLTLCVLSIYLYSTRRLMLEVVPGALITLVAFGVVTLKSLDVQTFRALLLGVRLRRRNALLRSIVESAEEGILGIDQLGTIQTANPARCAPVRSRGVGAARLIDYHFIACAAGGCRCTRSAGRLRV